MELLRVIVLGLVQGMTEFLPVSSSGHLVLFQHLFGLTEPELLLDICLHAGTLVAVIAVFYKEIQNIIVTLIKLPLLMRREGGFVPLWNKNEEVRIASLIVIGSIPTGLLGILFSKLIEQLFSGLIVVGMMLLLTGSILWITRYIRLGERSIMDMNGKDALIIGLVQGLAIMPGISRSGSTISTGILLGIDRQVIGRYSFLLSIPAILGALVLGIDAENIHSSMSPPMILVGTIVAALSGYVSLMLLLKIVRKGRLYFFAPYCWCIAIVTLIISF